MRKSAPEKIDPSGLLERNVVSRAVGEIVGKLERSHASEVRQIDAWTREEMAQILDLARELEPQAYPIFHLLFSTGMRRGEALGLKWDDVDGARHKIHVRRARSHGHAKEWKVTARRHEPAGGAGVKGTARPHTQRLDLHHARWPEAPW